MHLLFRKQQLKNAHHFTYSLWRCTFAQRALLLSLMWLCLEWNAFTSAWCDKHTTLLNCSFKLCHAKRFAFHTLKHFSSISSRRMDNVCDLVCIIVKGSFFSSEKSQKHDTATHTIFIYSNSILFDRLLKRVRVFNFAIIFNYWIQFFSPTKSNNSMWFEKNSLFDTFKSLLQTCFVVVVIVQQYGRLKWLTSPLHDYPKNWCPLIDFSLFCRQDFLSVTNYICWELCSRYEKKSLFFNKFSLKMHKLIDAVIMNLLFSSLSSLSRNFASTWPHLIQMVRWITLSLLWCNFKINVNQRKND